MVIGWLAGLIGTIASPRVGWVFGAVGLFLGGGAWAVSRIGGAGVAAALIGCVAAGGMAIEAHHFTVATTARIVDLPSLAAWDPDSDIIAARVPKLDVLRDQRAWVRVRTGSGKTATSTTQVATPLLETATGLVVGFHCRGEPGDDRGDGRWVLSSAAWTGNGPLSCAPSVSKATEACKSAGIPVAEGAQTRLVEVFASEAGLRTAYDMRAAIGVPLSFFVLYTVLVVIMRERGASASRTD